MNQKLIKFIDNSIIELLTFIDDIEYYINSINQNTKYRLVEKNYLLLINSKIYSAN